MKDKKEVKISMTIFIVMIIVIALLSALVIFSFLKLNEKNIVEYEDLSKTNTLISNNDISEENENVNKLESSNYTKKFELNYYQRKDLGLKTIINHNTNTDYRYSVHTLGGDVNFTIENDMVYTFEKALEEKVLTVEDILNQARIDAEYGVCEERNYRDGGSTEFMYEDYTILKYNTLEGLEDLVIGYKGPIINEANKVIKSSSVER